MTHAQWGRARPPLVHAEAWQAVMAAAEWRCECTGECGGHRSQPACPREDTQAHRLHVIPRDPHTSPLEAMRLRAGDLRAVCEQCHAGIARIARRDRARRQAEALRRAQQSLL